MNGEIRPIWMKDTPRGVSSGGLWIRLNRFFAESPYSGCEELFYMPRPVFQFYLISFKKSVYSKRHAEHERFGLFINVVCCLRKCVDRSIPEVVDLIRLGYFLLTNSRYFRLDREARMELRRAIQEAKGAVVAQRSGP